MVQARLENEENSYKIERVVEAALFMSNKTLSFGELCELTKTSDENLALALEVLKSKYEQGDRAVEIIVNSDSKTVGMQVKAKWLSCVANLTEKVELARKSTKILALIAKKGELLQSDLRKYFRGDIYEYVGELREKEYIERSKKGHSWLLKPSKKFHEEFQISQEEVPEPVAVQEEKGEENG